MKKEGDIAANCRLNPENMQKKHEKQRKTFSCDSSKNYAEVLKIC